jgi:alpha-L-fucosidase
MINRRDFLKNAAIMGAAAAALPACTGGGVDSSKEAQIDIAEGHAEPDEWQKGWMDLKFGMFVHFGINTYYDMEWSDGTLDPVKFNPTQLDTDQWCRVAKAAGMKYIVITTKHHDGFALWPSKYSKYTVAASPFKKDVIAILANSAQKYGLKLGLYYSIWDEHDPRFKNDWWAFMDFQYKQVEELLTGYGDVVELWLDGFWKQQKNGWEKKLENIDGEAGFQEKNLKRDLDFIQSWRNEGAFWWQMDYFYQYVKSLQPGCLMMNNSTTAYPGVPLHPVDIRSGEKYTEVKSDRKVWNWLGKDKYLPLQIETTMSIKGDKKFPTGNWFWHDWDHSVRPVEDIKQILNVASGMNANLLLNVGISDKGLLRKVDEENLLALNQ